MVGRGLGAGLAPAQDGAYAREQLAWLEGLGQVVVGADLQADHAVHGVALGGEHQHRHLGGRARQRAYAPAHLQAVHVGQHQVQDHQVGQLAALQLRQAARAIGHVRHLQPGLAEVFAHHLREAVVVFDHQQLRVHGWHLGIALSCCVEVLVKLGKPLLIV
ncbi:hypothetical protein ALISP_5814 [Alicycliphilus sp. B1]|nr:hypothetical protein ALISP_5814 [Alicycliphilus sp. B1]